MRRLLILASILSLTASLTASVAAPSAAQDGATNDGVVRVFVRSIRNGDGQAGCTLWDQGGGFPYDVPRSARAFWVPIREGGRASCVFLNVAPGSYAVGVMHDEDGDSRMGQNLFGVPQEGWGVSNNVGPRPFGPPTFEAASFDFDGTERRLSVRMRY